MADIPYELDLPSTGHKRPRSESPCINALTTSRATQHARKVHQEQFDDHEVNLTPEAYDPDAKAWRAFKAKSPAPEHRHMSEEPNVESESYCKQIWRLIMGDGPARQALRRRNEQSSCSTAELRMQLDILQRKNTRLCKRTKRLEYDLADEKHLHDQTRRAQDSILAMERKKSEQTVRDVAADCEAKIKRTSLSTTDRICKAEQRTAQVEGRYQDLLHTLKNLQSKMSSQEKLLKENESLKRELAAAREEKRAAEERARLYKQKIETLEKTTRSLQARALQSIESEKWAPLSVSDIQHELKALLSEVKQWAQAHSELSFHELLQQEHWNSFQDALLKLNAVSKPERLWDALNKNRLVQKSSKACSLLIASVASFFVLQQVIADPFFAFVAEVHQPGILWDDDGQSLRGLTDRIKSYDESGAEAWRCQSLRLIHPTTAQNSSKIAAKTLSNTLLTEILRLDLHQIKDTGIQDELVEILEQAACLSWRLWTRKTRITVHDGDAMAALARPHRTQVYNATSNLLEAHPLHNRDLDDDPKALDGREIFLLCNPLVTISGDGDGGNYQKHTILRKAVCWMG
ncbi:hypothetical protein AC579_10243 [Pseudocercospora musae]|uniref:Uncharacterized protein n=1 Tax=Pseudocercospora musae TaxID=113226 RepID=A0A139I1U0_9PEZI|nr:hypothetical protein AC579_10243 [Pseudocercospora musae]